MSYQVRDVPSLQNSFTTLIKGSNHHIGYEKPYYRRKILRKVIMSFYYFAILTKQTLPPDFKSLNQNLI